MTRTTKSAVETLLVAEGHALPADALVTEKLGWLGRTGSGKTYGAMQLAEQMLDAGVQVIALDPVGVWAGLRMDGPDWPVYILGGLYGDLPLDPAHGAAVAELVTREGLSAVLDVSQFETQSEVTRFAEDFATALYAAKKRNPSALHLFVEEAQEFVPQNPEPRETKMLRAFERLWKLGRNFGIGGSLISQRPQELNKKALNQAGVLFVFQLTGPQERKAVEYWMAHHGQAGSSSGLTTLKRGQPYLWAPDLGLSDVVAIPPKRSRDVSRTPLVGEARARLRTRAMDVAAVREALQTLAGADDAPDDTPAPADTAAGDYAQSLRVREAEARAAAAEVRLAEVQAMVGAMEVRLMDIVKTGFAEVQQRLHLDPGAAVAAPVETPAMVRPIAETTVGGFAAGRKAAETAYAYAGLSKTAGKLLATLVSFGAMPERRLRLLAGYRVGGGYTKAMAQLRRDGLLMRDADALTATEKGRKLVPRQMLAQIPQDRAGRVEFWAARFGHAEGRILRAVAAKPMPEEALLHALNYRKGGAWTTALARLRKAGLLGRRVSDRAIICLL